MNIGTGLISCKRKVRYGHKETAEQAARDMAKKGSGKMSAYPCSVCLGWHIGHRSVLPSISVTWGGKV